MISSKYGIFDNMIEGVQVIDPRDRYVYLNAAAIAQSRTSKEELIGKTMQEKYPGIGDSELYRQITTCRQQRSACSMLNHFEFPDGTEGWFDLRLEPVEEGVLIMSFDISKQKQMEKELQRMNEELERRVDERTKELQDSLTREKELNELKSAFVSMASHEFRSPLATILSSTSLAERYGETGQEEKRQKHLNRIKASVTHLTLTLDDFLSLNKLESGKAEYHSALVDLAKYSEELLEDLRLLCRNGQHINHRHVGRSGPVKLDRNVMRNVLFNLVSNAIKYSPNGEDIELTTELTDDTFIICVKDKGIGIPEEDKQKMFGKFFRASNASPIQGTGLGLSIVKKYVELAGGDIGFTSRMDEGTTFVVTIPQPETAVQDS
ncbi:MAG TPA: ATP-binding protein [Bacteroidia bacterium]|nr:ATP-binding protein [Bacteroidia bacterium]